MIRSQFTCLAALTAAVFVVPGEPTAAQQSTSKDSTADTVAIAQAEQVLTAELTAVTLAQAAYHHAHHIYAASARLLQNASGFTVSPGIWLIILEARPDGWSAVAADSAVPEVRCATYSGKANPPFADHMVDSDIVCRSEPVPSKPFPVADDASPQPPQQLHCEVRRLPVRLPRPGRVMLQFVLDEDGHPDPTSVRFITSPDLLDDVSALVVLSGCEYRPAQVGKQHIRVLVHQAIDLRQ
jgi:hypothetical protein